MAVSYICHYMRRYNRRDDGLHVPIHLLGSLKGVTYGNDEADERVYRENEREED
jgi:hypothetical protein